MSTSNKKIAVVTGASKGIGKACAMLFREKGFSVIGLARSFDNTQDARQLDLGNEQNVESVFKNILSEYGRIDILVNSAGIATTTDSLKIPVSEWEDIFRVNVIGSYLCCRNVLPAMREQGYGRVVNVSSIAGRLYSQSASLAYTASKHAVIGLTKQLAAEWGQYGINVNCVCPSQTKTEMLMKNVSDKRQEELAQKIPLGRLAEPVEVAEAICFLASEAASYINGAVLDVNGGQL